MHEFRHQLITLCRRTRARQLGWPRDWRPNQVVDPRTGSPFTEAGAWEYVAELLENEHALEEMTLDQPRGARAVVLLVQQPPGFPPLYVKLQLGAGIVIGRSFHYSYS